MSDNRPYEYAEKYMFYAEWYNEVAEVIKPFLLSFYPHDQTLELFDLKCNRLFLRRTKVEGITLSSLYVGAIINVFCRQITIVNYANAWTENVFQVALQKIFALVKPEAVSKVGCVIGRLEENGFKITKLRMGVMTKDALLNFYGENFEKGLLYHDIVNHMTGGPCIAIEAIGEKGWSKWMEMVGPDDPGEARNSAPDSLRASLGAELLHNAIHTSSNPSDQARECQVWFPTNPKKTKLIEPSCVLSNSTCCIIKPHSLVECNVGSIINLIVDSGFRIHALQMFQLDRAAAEEFYEVYKGVVPEYSSMVSQLSSGPCIVMEVSSIEEPSSSAVIFRKLAGPNNPVIARRVDPHSLRAKFGSSTILNAVHCTDLPEDANLELEYFFKIYPSRKYK